MTVIHHSSLCTLSYDRSIPLAKRLPYRVRYNASSFNFQYPLFSRRLPSSCLRLLLRLSVPSILPCTFLSITWFRRHFLRKMWPVHLAFLLFIACKTLLFNLTPYNTSCLTRSVHWSSSFYNTTFQNFPGISDLLSECPRFIKPVFQTSHFTRLFLKFKSNLLVKRAFFFWNAAFAMAILNLIYILHHLLSCYPNSCNTPHSPLMCSIINPFFNCHTTRTTVKWWQIFRVLLKSWSCGFLCHKVVGLFRCFEHTSEQDNYNMDVNTSSPKQ